MEERAGERRIVFGSGPSPQSSPHSPHVIVAG
jgi:hypothetical protein